MKPDKRKSVISFRISTWIASSIATSVGAAVLLHYTHAMAAAPAPHQTTKNSAAPVPAIHANGQPALPANEEPDSDAGEVSAADQDVSQLAAADTQKTDGDRLEMLQDLEKIRLQSVCMNGDHPACMIDDRLYHEGEPIHEFTVERIGQSGVVVRNGTYRFELKIAS